MLSLEDLRPSTLDGMVGQDEAVRLLKGLVDQQRKGIPIPHLLFSGPFGVGKTTAAYAVGRAILGETWEHNFKELVTEENRGLEVIRREVIDWLPRAVAYGAPFKLLFLDEADYITEPGQQALRRAMETESDSTRFILACNTPSKVIGAIHSRCLTVRFRPLSNDEVERLIRSVAARLGRTVTPDLVQSIQRHAKGQARDVVNSLLGGQDGDAGRWGRLDSAIVALFTPNGISRDARIMGFLEFCRVEGHTEWEEVLKTMTDLGRSGVLSLPKGFEHCIRESTTTAYRANVVKLPMYQVEGFLYEVVP